VNLAAGAVTGAKVADGSLSAADLTSGTVTTDVIADGTVQAVDLADGAVATGKLADEAVTSAKLANGTVQASDLANGAVTGAKIAGDALVGAGDVSVERNDDDALEISFTGELSEGDITSVTAGTGLTGGSDEGAVTLGIADGGVNTPQLADGAVNAAKLAGDAAVTALNGLSGGVSLAEGDNIDIEADGSQITISAVAPEGGLTSVSTNGTLTGNGTSDSPLGIEDGGVDTPQLADGAVNTAKLADNAAVTALNDQVGLVTLEGENGLTVTSSEGTITISPPDGDGDSGIQGVQNTDGSLSITDPNGPTTTINVLDDGITAAKLADGAVSTAKLADEAVTGAKLAAGAAVFSLNGGAGSLTLEGANGTTVERDGSVITITAPDGDGGGGIETIQADGTLQVQDPNGPTTTLSIAPDGVTNTELAPDAVTSANILDGTITTADINNGAVTAGKLGTSNAPGADQVLGYDGSTLVWREVDNGDAPTSSGTQPSSIRWKEEVRTLADPLALVERLRGVRYTWTESGEADVGVIAEEVAEVLPEVVAFEADGQARGVNYGKLVSVLIEATKVQQQDLTTKEQTIEQQREEIDALKGRVERLEQLVQQQLSAAQNSEDVSHAASDESASPRSRQ
jgi:hypothetical protein